MNKSPDLESKNSKYIGDFDENTITYLSSEILGKDITYKRSTVLRVLSLYSNFDGIPHTAQEISRKTGIPTNRVQFIIKAHGKNHHDLPVLSEFDQRQEEEIIEDLLAEKDINIRSKFDKANWKKVEEDAAKWLALKTQEFDPFEKFLSTWKPPHIQLRTPVKLSCPKSNKTFVIALSDLHYGAKADKRYMFNNKGWTTQKTVEAVDNFANEIIQEVQSRNYKFKKCVILGIGDLIHSLNGKTQRGTELIFDCIKEEQLEYAMNSLLAFFIKIRDCFTNIEVHNVGGNHHYEMDMAIFKALEMYFHKDKSIKFTHYATRPAAFKCDATLFMLDHGADSRERVYVPSGSKLEKHVQSILLNNTHLLENVKTRLFVQGDKHHFEHLEFGTFEYIMFSTIVGADEHANVNNWHNRARQSCLVLDDKGLREIIHVFFE